MNKFFLADLKFMAIFNKSGVAFASNLPNSVRQISLDPAVALVFNPLEMFKWNQYIENFLRANKGNPFTTIEEIGSSFKDFINKSLNLKRIDFT